jgi:transcriptional regulator of met regulon
VSSRKARGVSNDSNGFIVLRVRVRVVVVVVVVVFRRRRRRKKKGADARNTRKRKSVCELFEHCFLGALFPLSQPMRFEDETKPMKKMQISKPFGLKSSKYQRRKRISRRQKTKETTAKN